ncbi:MAG: helix-turn-helix domain-containing protein [Candidatus Azobacteroides sp.]|nr:helix-turn-helix domain-containing protein [Candidatus Azobacteroides sp.]
MFNKKFFSFFLFILSCSRIFSGINSEELSFSHLTVKDGLSSNYVRNIFRDKEGFVWIGTTEGLDRFDGCLVKQYPLFIRGEQRKGEIYAVCEKGTDLFIVSAIGLYFYNRKQDSLKLACSPPDNIHYTSLFVNDTYRYIILGSDKGLHILNEDLSRKEILLPNEHIVSIKKFKDQFLILTEDALYIMSISREESFHIRCILFHEWEIRNTEMICKEPYVYIGTKNHGLYCFEPDNPAFYKVEEITSNIIVSLFLHEESLFVGSNGKGLEILNLETRKVRKYINDFKDPYSVSSNSIYSIFVDNHHICWLGMYSLGISYTRQQDDFFNVYDGLDRHSIRTFHVIDSLQILAGTRNGFIYREKENNFIYYSADHEAIRSDIVLSISHFRDNNYLIGTYGGGFYIFNKADKEITESPLDERDLRLLKYESVYGSIYLNEKIYLLTLNGLFIIKDNKIRLHLNDGNSGLLSSYIFSYLEDKDGIWLGTAKGLCFYSYGSDNIESVPLKNIQNDFRINYIYKDSKNSLWLCTENYGLLRFYPESREIETISKKLAISTDHVAGIIEDNDHIHYWISTGNGFYRYNEKSGRVKAFGPEDGLAYQSFCMGACRKTPENRLLFGAEYGLVYFCPVPENNREYNPRLIITDLFIDHKVLSREDNRVHFNEAAPAALYIKEDSNLKIRLVNSNFKNGGTRSFAYQLSSDPDEWIYINDNNILEIQNLKEGAYSVYVKCSDDEFSWSQPQEIITIYVKKSFFQTPHFRISCACICLLVVLVLLRKKNKIMLAIDILKKSRKLKKKDKKNSSDIELTEQIIGKLRIYMEEERPYINPNFSIKDLADNTGYSVHQISQVLNTTLGSNFSDFINEYKIEDVKVRLQGNELETLTLLAIAEQCGFNSKTSFYRIFKKFTGVTPLEYRKRIKKQVGNKNQELK